MVTATGRIIVTEALAFFVVSAADVAVTVIKAGLGTADGAVKSPLVEIVPQAAPAQPLPETLHDTAVFVVPVTVTTNCCLPPVTTWTAAGATATTIGGMIVTEALPDFVESAADVAVTETRAGLGTIAGAV
jgi:hypothetical protein